MAPCLRRLVGARRCVILLSTVLTAACVTVPEIPEVIVGGLDYSFDLATVQQPGPLKIGFENRGEVPHELILVRLNPDVRLVDLLAGMEAGDDPEDFADGFFGILIADPGESSLGRLYVELESGRSYAMLCMFEDEEGDPPHVALGMTRSFTVD